jgi:hypothetical protein
VAVRAIVLVALVACGGKAAVEDGHTGSAGSGGSAGSAGSAGSGTGTGTGSSAAGDLQIRVEWPDVPVAMRASPGRTPCKTARLPYVAPSTTWGVPDVILLVDGLAPPAATVRIVAKDCVLSPRVAVAPAGSTLALASETETPLLLSVMHTGDPHDDKTLAAVIETPGSLPDIVDRVQLPVVGHTATLSLGKPAADAIYSDAPDSDGAWVVTWPGPSAVTDAAGQATLRGLTPGKHAVVAWLPPRAGQGAMVARGTADVSAGVLAELTLTLK